jgi:hypothetical protein
MNRRTFLGVLSGAVGVLGIAGLSTSVGEMGTAQAARRPTPTPTPVRCYGRKINVGGVCVCPPEYPATCGVTCCETPAQCCGNACCNPGTYCCGEEMCCPIA